ncbi:hypothetical protein OIU34_18230 [Pararhizobium sp. BT-229]|uniref:hypothetical protein n=1 Tax=Pararhizobium sp. BT-229 TaxID=2986923 RepID=UPI0021F6B542|nr:hypothetical protein [Pararhizobium sp. BT-229]MCV9963818.1 hypothetical protein [Pararhizobium sp. BT-229]
MGKVQARHLVFASPMSSRELLVQEISGRLLEAGIGAYPPRFPFGAHHDYFRTRLRPDGKHAKLGDVSGALTAWAAARESDEDYVWQAVCGFLLSYFAQKPEHRDRLPHDIEGRMDALGWGDDFLCFARAPSRQA